MNRRRVRHLENVICQKPEQCKEEKKCAPGEQTKCTFYPLNPIAGTELSTAGAANRIELLQVVGKWHVPPAPSLQCWAQRSRGGHLSVFALC